MCSSAFTVGEDGHMPGWLGVGQERTRCQGLGCLLSSPASPRAHAFGATVEATPMNTWETKGCLHERESPLPQHQAKRPVKQTAAKHTPSKEAVRKNFFLSHLGSHNPGGQAAGKAPSGLAKGQRTHWRAFELERTSSWLLRPEQTRECTPEQGSLTQEQGWGRS